MYSTAFQIQKKDVTVYPFENEVLEKTMIHVDELTVGENMDVKFSFGEGSLFGFDSWEGVTQGEHIF